MTDALISLISFYPKFVWFLSAPARPLRHSLTWFWQVGLRNALPHSVERMELVHSWHILHVLGLGSAWFNLSLIAHWGYRTSCLFSPISKRKISDLWMVPLGCSSHRGHLTLEAILLRRWSFCADDSILSVARIPLSPSFPRCNLQADCQLLKVPSGLVPSWTNCSRLLRISWMHPKQNFQPAVGVWTQVQELGSGSNRPGVSQIFAPRPIYFCRAHISTCRFPYCSCLQNSVSVVHELLQLVQRVCWHH